MIRKMAVRLLGLGISMVNQIKSGIFFLLFLVSCINKKTNLGHEILPPSNSILECNPDNAHTIISESIEPLQNGTSYIKAASGVVANNGSLYIVQDSSRFLAQLTLQTKKISFHPLAAESVISKLENPRESYSKFRKERKADFEAITLLPDGTMLILGSGYDAHQIGSKNHYKNVGVIFDPKTQIFQSLDLAPFYRHLLERSDVVGKEKDGISPRLNIEGAVVFEDKVAFFHRSNYNKNFHDAVIIYNLQAWLTAVEKSQWQLQELSLQQLNFGFVQKDGKKFPITLNDATYKQGFFVIPLACEIDKIVDGKDIDGEVVWTGIAKIKVDNPQSCEMYHLINKNLPKVEGLYPVSDGASKWKFFAVHDIDDENQASLLSMIDLTKTK